MNDSDTPSVESLAASVEEALREGRRADAAEQANALGNALSRANDSRAEAAYRRAIELDPALYKPHVNLGSILLRRGDREGAVAHYLEATRLEPSAHRAHYNLAVVRMEQGDARAAVESARAAVSCRPDMGDAWLLLGRAGAALDDPALGAEAAEALLALRPLKEHQHAAALAHGALGARRDRDGQIELALASLRRAVELAPDHAGLACDLGRALSVRGDADEGLRWLERAVTLAPAYAGGHFALGSALQGALCYGEAIAHYRRAIELGLSLPEVHNNLGVALMATGEVVEGIEQTRYAYDLQPSNPRFGSNLLLMAQYLADTDPEALLAEHRRWAERHADSLWPAVEAPVVDPDPSRRLRVAYLSADVRTHSVARFIEPVLGAHDRAEVEVVLYADVARPDAVTRRLGALADAVCDVSELSPEAIAERVRRDRIDVLVELGGHTSPRLLLVMARRPAPVQVTWLGYPDTTGLRAIDHRLTDAVADPPDAESRAVEALVRLPIAWCYGPGEAPPPITAPPSMVSGRVTFGSFNMLSKLQPPVLEAWAAILQRVPGSRLLLKAKGLDDAPTREALLGRFEALGVARARVQARGVVAGFREHLALYGEVDVGLDPFPYNGTTTTCEALAMGVPVVTLSGDTHASRVGASLLGAVGLGDLVTRSPSQYVEAAAALARDAARLQTLRRQLRLRVAASPLGSPAVFTRALEASYRAMWRRRCEGGAPARAETSSTHTAVEMPDGVTVLVPAGLETMTTWVLQEQGDWFEDETRFVRGVVEAGERVLDVGANFGVYTLSLARATGPSGAVLAFEPTARTAAYLRRSLAANGFGWVTLEQAALSDSEGEMALSIGMSPELNRLGGTGERTERVAVKTLARYRDALAGVSFVKLDAEGAERAIVDGDGGLFEREDPLVMFELKHGAEVNAELAGAFEVRGYGLYRLVPGLNLLAPFRADAIDPFDLNLFAAKPARARRLAARGLLAEAVTTSPSLDPRAGEALRRAMPHGAPLGLAVPESMAWFATSRAASEPGLRVAALECAVTCARRELEDRGVWARRLTLARVARAAGRRALALEALAAALAELESATLLVREPFLPALARYDALAAGDLRAFALAQAIEAWVKLSAFSGYFQSPEVIDLLESFEGLGFPDDEMRRRLALARVRKAAAASRRP